MIPHGLVAGCISISCVVKNFFKFSSTFLFDLKVRKKGGDVHVCGGGNAQITGLFLGKLK